MRPTCRFIATMLLLAPSSWPAEAQRYVRHWNTVVVTPPVRAAGITTGALASAAAALVPHSSRGGGLNGQTGLASYYWQGQRTASGETFDKNALTAAHKTLPMNTRVRVTHAESGRSVVVRINDRGPFKPGRIIDLSDHAAEILGFKPKGLALVKLEVIP